MFVLLKNYLKLVVINSNSIKMADKTTKAYRTDATMQDISYVLLLDSPEYL